MNRIELNNLDTDYAVTSRASKDPLYLESGRAIVIFILMLSISSDGTKPKSATDSILDTPQPSTSKHEKKERRKKVAA